jgi:hypothetical protein
LLFGTTLMMVLLFFSANEQTFLVDKTFFGFSCSFFGPDVDGKEDQQLQAKDQALGPSDLELGVPEGCTVYEFLRYIIFLQITLLVGALYEMCEKSQKM